MRQVQINLRERGGDVQVLLISSHRGCWEEPWDLLRGTAPGALLSVVLREDVEHALHGLSQPLSAALGLPPEGCLLKLPKTARRCHREQKCPLYDPRVCHLQSGKLPLSFEPAGFDDDRLRLQIAELVRYWREEVYVVVVEEPEPA